MLGIDGESLTLESVWAVAVCGEKLELREQARARMAQAHASLMEMARLDQPMYGINTGLGGLVDQRISSKESQQLSRNLVLSHAMGSGAPLPNEVVRAAMLVRANSLAKGYSGVRPELVALILEMLNRGVTPLVPAQGSLGSSGDLIPLAHVALVLSRGEEENENESGQAFYEGQLLSGQRAMEAAGLQRLVLGPKEGLALCNGASFSAAIGALVCKRAARICTLSDLAVAMSLESMAGNPQALDARLHRARPHEGQGDVAAAVRSYLQGSELAGAGGRLQDAYSLRCSPQIQGPLRDVLGFVEHTLEIEVNSATDNPLVVADGEALSGGNFHGQPIGLAMDYLKIALTVVASVSERRIARLLDAHASGGLSPMLIDPGEEPGLNSGLMMAQYEVASLCLENQGLAAPDSVRSLPTSAGQEDLNANAMTAARHAAEVAENCEHVLATEIYLGCRGIDLRLRASPGVKMGAGTGEAYRRLRSVIPYHAGEKLWGQEIQKAREAVAEGLLDNLPEFVSVSD